METLKLSTHTGTHLDAPAHFARGRWGVSDIPLERLVDVPAVVIDITAKVANESNYELSMFDVHAHERDYGPIPDNCLLLVKTGWSKKWTSRAQYFGTDTNDVTKVNFPGNTCVVVITSDLPR